MIRTFQPQDLTRVLEIWLQANLQAHSFLPASYWTGHLETVREQLPQAEVCVFEEAGQIDGFIGLTDSYIAGIFVDPRAQSQGIGSQLLNQAKAAKPRLTLHVYQKNQRALSFYQREGFSLQPPRLDPGTNELECEMVWTRPA